MIILDVEGKCKGFFEKNRKKLKGGSRSGIISNIWASILSKNGGYRVSMIKIKDYVREERIMAVKQTAGRDALDEDGAEAGADGD